MRSLSFTVVALAACSFDPNTVNEAARLDSGIGQPDSAVGQPDSAVPGPDAGPAMVTLIAGVDFEGANAAEFDRNPDDYDLADGISVSSGTSSPMFDGWTLLLLDGGDGTNGNMRNDAGANGAGATSPNFPARLEGSRTGSWAITISAGVVLDLDRIEFDVRGATNGSGRDGQFRTSLDAPTAYLWEDLNLPGRTSGNWQHLVVDLSGAPYQALSDQTLSFIWRATNSGAIDLDTIELFGTVTSN